MTTIVKRFRDLGRKLYDAEFPASIIHVPMGAAPGALSAFAFATYATRHPSMVGKILYNIGFVLGVGAIGLEVTKEIATQQYSALLPTIVATNTVSAAFEYFSRVRTRTY